MNYLLLFLAGVYILGVLHDILTMSTDEILEDLDATTTSRLAMLPPQMQQNVLRLMKVLFAIVWPLLFAGTLRWLYVNRPINIFIARAFKNDPDAQVVVWRGKRVGNRVQYLANIIPPDKRVKVFDPSQFEDGL